MTCKATRKIHRNSFIGARRKTFGHDGNGMQEVDHSQLLRERLSRLNTDIAFLKRDVALVAVGAMVGGIIYASVRALAL